MSGLFVQFLKMTHQKVSLYRCSWCCVITAEPCHGNHIFTSPNAQSLVYLDMKNILFILVCCVALVGCESGGECIEGDCENGQGTYTYGSGEWGGYKYEGEWKDGKKHGQGTYTYANGSIAHSGLWKDEQPVK